MNREHSVHMKRNCFFREWWLARGFRRDTSRWNENTCQLKMNFIIYTQCSVVWQCVCVRSSSLESDFRFDSHTVAILYEERKHHNQPYKKKTCKICVYLTVVSLPPSLSLLFIYSFTMLEWIACCQFNLLPAVNSWSCCSRCTIDSIAIIQCIQWLYSMLFYPSVRPRTRWAIFFLP